MRVYFAAATTYGYTDFPAWPPVAGQALGRHIVQEVQLLVEIRTVARPPQPRPPAPAARPYCPTRPRRSRPAAIGAGQGVYMSSIAELLQGAETTRGIEAFSRRSVAHGGPEWTSQDVRPGTGLRLYRATAGSHWILAKDGRPYHRIPVPLT